MCIRDSYSTSSYSALIDYQDSMFYFKRQLIFCVVGLGVLYVVSKIDYHWYITVSYTHLDVYKRQEQKARTTYDNILRLVKDPEVCDPIRFLREREIVHYQRFGEAKSTYASKK